MSSSTQRARLATVLAFAFGMAGVSVVIVGGDPHPTQVSHAGWLMAVAFAANLAIVLFAPGDEVENASGFIPVIIGALAYGPVSALSVAVVSGLPYVWRDPRRALRVMTSRALAAAVVAVAFDHHRASDETVTGFLVEGFGLTLIYQLMQLIMASTIVALQSGGTVFAEAKANFRGFMLAWLLFGPMAVAYGYLSPHAPTAVLFAAFVVAASHQLLLNLQRARAFHRVMTTMSAEVPGALLAALDASDAYTAQHSAAVASYAYDLAVAVGYDDRRARRVHAAALLHDIGKIGIPPSVLAKPGRLTDEEFAEIQRHPELGARFISRLPGFEVLGPAILEHHERMDGTGYPQRKLAADISEEAQIIAIADTYSAITSTRSYRQARAPAVAIMELRKDAERTRLNAIFVEAFVLLLDGKDESYRTGRHSDLQTEVSRVAGWLDLFEASESASVTPRVD